MPDDILSIYAASQPDKPGVIEDRPDGAVVTWTYAELEAQSNRVANLLLELGAGPRTNILWCGPNSLRSSRRERWIRVPSIKPLLHPISLLIGCKATLLASSARLPRTQPSRHAM